MAVEQLLSRLDGVRENGRGRWLARCSGHEDRSPSLSIRELDDGRVLVHCFAGCTVDEVVGGAGLELQDLFPDKPQAQDFVKGERRPFPAADVLRAIADESLLVAVAAGNIGQGVELTAEDRERIFVAADRIQTARSLALGER